MTPELTSEAPRTASTPQHTGGADHDDRAAVFHVRSSLVFLALGSALLAVAAGRLVFPDYLSNVAPLAYGRLQPAAIDLLVYGWLTIGLVGAGYYILPRVSDRRLAYGRAGLVGGGLLAVGVLAGGVAVALGRGTGRQYLEFPIWANAIILVGLLVAVVAFSATIVSGGDRPLAPIEWFYGSAPIWLVLSLAVAIIPGLAGVNEELQTAFFRDALFGLWLAAASLGVVYYVVSRVTGRDPRRITQLAVIGFWSLAGIYALASGSRLTYTAAPDWLETLSGVFSIALFLPVAVIVVDISAALRGMKAARGRATLRLILAGAVAFAVIPFANAGLAMRSSSSIVGLTDWVAALDLVALLGTFTFWLAAFLHHSFVSAGRGSAHYRISALAVAVAVGSLFVGGVQTGLSWVAAANALEVSAGEGFVPSVVGDGHLWVRFVALCVFALAQLVLLVSAWSARTGPDPDEIAGGSAAPNGNGEEDDVATAEDEEYGPAGLPLGVPVSLRAVRTGTLGVFVAVALFSFGFPALEADNVNATRLGDEVRSYDDGDLVRSYEDAEGVVVFSYQVEDAARGRDVYLAEGCWYCHTQGVREIVTDVGLGPVAVAGDYANEEPSVFGVMRTGPDLMFAGSRDTTPGDLGAFIEDPRATRPWSTMPAHDYLSDADLEAVGVYVASLRRFENQ